MATLTSTLLPLRTLLPSLVLLSCLSAQDPGSVFRDHVWQPQPGPQKWERVTGADATHSGALAFLPNPVHTIAINDFVDAVACEVIIEKLTSHSGTRKPRMRVNGNAWIALPEPDTQFVPGTQGSGLPATEYLQMTYPVINLPLAQLQAGNNSFEFACEGAGGSAIGRTWPQWLHYGVNFRIYYKATKAGAPTGQILTPRDGDVVGDDPIFDIQALAASNSSIARVDLLGDYNDFDFAGDSSEQGWRQTYRYGSVGNNMGTLFAAPWRLQWQTKWLPTQHKYFRVAARIAASNGLTTMSPAIHLGMARSKSVHRYRAFNIARTWQSRASNYKTSNVTVTGDLTKASEARCTLATWNATSLNELRLNDLMLRGPFGRGYDVSHDSHAIDLSRLNAGWNTFSTFATTLDHGCEVLWPGIEVFVRYDIPETPGVFVPYSTSCNGSSALPVLSNLGTPLLNQSYTARLEGGPVNTPVILLNGFSKDLWSGFNLPFDWAPIGAPGCVLATSIEFTLGLATDAQGVATQLFTVPNRQDFVGGSLFAQYLILDPTANALGLTLSDAGRWLFGK